MSAQPNLAEVVTLHPHLDIPAMLRQMADNIEKGVNTDGEEMVATRSATCVVEHDDGSVEVYGWADTGLLRSIGLLHLGIERLARMRLRSFEE